MRVWLLVYGVLYVVMEMVGHSLAVVGWAQITTLDVATALTDAFLVVAICAAVGLAGQMGLRRWRRIQAQRPHVGPVDARWDDEPIEVTAWRPTPEEMADPPTPPPPAQGTYGGHPYTFAGRRWPTGPGRQL
ncbi:hypothetical protein [Blastococcus sp. PRF04-17]|uniref:hypothetical protein n=1 Tax=Blastococcus sp. PRF04-17 TaxID=2933797 RepID=UPI001FF0ED4B|nr:hypothetical protein [Blastococcus sp. PRF04-17]UOY02073.1 hypothetical protein MVA48_01415 [Blastococcus sp. PRF04-17]